ncbi:hypothetical protein [Roseovarius ramblicola]|uniref:Uncharacterized protein n=1 Tax=Roseovarius ramblicola TaxID=2022336 RepID=A0ABV5HYR3_9RHOB
MADHFDLDATLFMAVRRALDPEAAIRSYLEGVMIEPRAEGGAFLVATDGWTMLVGLDATAIAPRPALVRLTMPEPPAPAYDEDGDLVPYRPWKDSRLRFGVQPGCEPFVAAFAWKVSGAHTHALIEEIAAADIYPDWRKVMTCDLNPKDRPRGYTHAGVCPDRLRRIEDDEQRLRIEAPDIEGKPYRIRFERGDLTGFIMPSWMKLDEDVVRPAISRCGTATTETQQGPFA